MSDQDRAYAPRPEAPLAFDARRPVPGGAPVPMTLIISGMVLLVLIAAVFFVYRGGLRSENGAPRPVGTAVNDIKSPAPPEAQPVDPAKGLEIYHAESGQPPPANTTDPTFTPPPEAPTARPAPKVVAETPPAVQPAQTAASAKPAPTAVAPVKAAALTPASPLPVTPKTAVIPTKPVAAPVKAVAAAKGASMVQVGAFSSSTAADKGWTDAARVAPGTALGKGKKVETVAQADGKTLYRTLMTGFASRQEAQSFCASLTAAGKKCLVK